MNKIYRKTATIQAEQFDGSDEMINKYDIKLEECDYTEEYGLSHDGVDPVFYERYFISTLEGVLECSVGDWIATGVKGEHWAIADDIFKQTYAELPVIPNYVAAYLKVSKNSKVTLFCAIYEAPELVTNHLEATLKYISYYPETFARAWLDGYQVEAKR